MTLDRFETVLSVADASSGPSGLEILGPIAGVVAAALIAAGVKFRSDSRGRLVESQREALYRLQDVSLTYRLALIRNSNSVLSPDEQRTVAELDGQLAAAFARCRADNVQTLAEQWQKTAEYYWSGAAEYDSRQELEAWTKLQRAVGVELRRHDA